MKSTFLYIDWDLLCRYNFSQVKNTESVNKIEAVADKTGRTH